MSLVPYAAGLGRLALPAYRSATAFSRWSPVQRQAAIKIAGFVGRNAFRTGKMAYRRFKRRRGSVKNKRRVRSRIGERVGVSTSKTALVSDTNVSLETTRTLNSQALIRIDKNVNFDDNIHQRHRDTVNLRGIKICFHFRNNIDETLLMNFAVVRPKEGGVVNSEFFRSQGEGSNRSLDFGIARSSIEFACLPINSDRYDIMMHKRFRLKGKAQSTDVEESGSNFKRIEKYLRINRQVKFDGTGVEPIGSSQLFAVWWSDKQMTNGGTGGTAFAVGRMQRIICYYREPK